MRRTSTRSARTTAIACLVALITTLAVATGSPATATESARYLVVFAGTENEDGSFELGGNFDVHYGTALALVGSAGGTVTHDLAGQIGVMVVESDNALFATTLRA